jgi:hypothetical protein
VVRPVFVKYGEFSQVEFKNETEISNRRLVSLVHKRHINVSRRREIWRR